MMEPANKVEDGFFHDNARNDQQKLFLLEVLVDNLNIQVDSSSPNLSKDLAANMEDTCVMFQFLHYPPLVVCESDFIGTAVSGKDTSHITFKSGKSCFFSLRAPKGPIKPVPFDVKVSVIRKMKAGVLPDKLEIGKTSIDMGENFTELLKQNTDDYCDALPMSKITKGTFDIKDDGGKKVGNLTAFLRISCFGKLIITQFSLNKEDEKKYLFKGTDLKEVCKQDLGMTKPTEVEGQGERGQGPAPTQALRAWTGPSGEQGGTCPPRQPDCPPDCRCPEAPVAAGPDPTRRGGPGPTRAVGPGPTRGAPTYGGTPYGNDIARYTGPLSPWEQSQVVTGPGPTRAAPQTYGGPGPTRAAPQTYGGPGPTRAAPQTYGGPGPTRAAPQTYGGPGPTRASMGAPIGAGGAPAYGGGGKRLCDCSYPVPSGVMDKFNQQQGAGRNMALAPGEVGLQDDQVIFQLPLKRPGDPVSAKEQQDSQVYYKLTSAEETRDGVQKNTVNVKSDDIPGMVTKQVSPVSGLPVDDGHDVFLLKIGKKCEGDKKRNLELELRTPKMKEPKPPMSDRDTQYLESDIPKASGKKGSGAKGKGKKGSKGGKKGKK